MTVYLDCCATTPVEQRVLDKILLYMGAEFGNAGSRTHEFGARAKQAVEWSREQVAEVVESKQDEVIFTSGATESNNLTILGLAEFGVKSRRKHIVSTQIEHKAVLEPLYILRKKGFEISLLPPDSGGSIDPEKIKRGVRDDTLLVSVMHVNNETGVVQPITEIAEMLRTHAAFFHVDAAQGFGKDIEPLRNQRLDFISISAHKIYGPKGVGVLVTRRREYKRPPLNALMYGGGQEHGLRPGTLPVHLIVGLGMAAELALKEVKQRNIACQVYRKKVIDALAILNPKFNGDSNKTLPHIINLSFPGLDSEAVMIALKNVIAVSNGSACTSQSYEPSHVLQAMGLPVEVIRGAIRISWSHMTEQPDWDEVVRIIKKLY